MEELSGSLHDVPVEVALLKPPHLQRQVYLKDPSPPRVQRHDLAARAHASGAETGQQESSQPRILVYAASWWNADTVGCFLKDASKPIWASLSQERTELYRDIRTVYYGECADLESRFETTGPFWGRDYLFWHSGQPLTVIHEVFSTSLCDYLGPLKPGE
jgi:chorismate-pyruvate lyase